MWLIEWWLISFVWWLFSLFHIITDVHFTDCENLYSIEFWKFQKCMFVLVIIDYVQALRSYYLKNEFHSREFPTPSSIIMRKIYLLSACHIICLYQNDCHSEIKKCSIETETYLITGRKCMGSSSFHKAGLDRCRCISVKVHFSPFLVFIPAIFNE